MLVKKLACKIFHSHLPPKAFKWQNPQRSGNCKNRQHRQHVTKFDMPHSQHSVRMDQSSTPSAVAKENTSEPSSSSVQDDVYHLRNPSLRSMLKTSIETEDVGQFSRRPSQLPLPTKPTLPFPPAADHQQMGRRSFARQYAENEVDGARSSNYPYPTSTTSSSVTSFHQTQSRQSYRASSQDPTDQEERSYSISQSSVINHGRSDTRLHAINRLQEQGDLRGSRPRSPYAYPTRLKRPGYRPSSPALIELHREAQGANQGSLRGIESRTTSPRYTSAMRRALPNWQQGYNQLDPSFRHHQTSPATRYSRTRPSPPSSPRMPTPGSLLSLNQNSSTSRESLAPVSARSGWTSGRSISSSPVFYDYTENFGEENNLQESMVPVAEGVVPEKAEADIEASPSRLSLPGSPSYNEVPSRRNGETLAVSEPLSSPNRRTWSHLPRWDAVKSYDYTIKTASADEGQITLASQKQYRRKTKSFIAEIPRYGGWNGASMASPRNTKTQRRSFAGMNGATASVAPTPRSASSSESMYSVQSSSCPDPLSLRLQSENVTLEQIPSEKPEIEHVGIQEQILSTKSDGQLSQESVAPGATSFDQWSDSEQSQIYAPKPERSLSSPSHRDRFSRIFDIEEGSPDSFRDDRAKSQISKYRAPERHMKERRIENSEATNTSLLPPEILLMDPPKVALALRRTNINQDVEDGQVKNSTPKESSIFKSISTSDHSPLGTRTKRMTIASCISASSIPIRTPELVQPELSLPSSPSQPATLDVVEFDGSTRNSDPSGMTLAGSNGIGPKKANLLLSQPSTASLVSCSPLLAFNPEPLPFSFAPLFPTETSDLLAAHADGGELSTAIDNGGEDIEEKESPRKPNDSAWHPKDSIESLPTSRPWNLDTSYPWTDQPPDLGVTMPQPEEDPQQNANKTPRFKMRLQRASSSTAGSSKLTKQRPSLEISVARKPRGHRPSVSITQTNSSHASQFPSRYSSNFNSPLASSIVCPSIKLVPPTPALNIEVRSYFSDDSSQMPPKGSLRKRLSQLKAIAVRAGSSEDVTDITDVDRGVLSSAMGKSRASGRSSRQEATPSERMYNLRHMKWRIVEKVRDWFHRGEEKFRQWGGKLTSKGLKEHAVSNTEQYSGG